MTKPRTTEGTFAARRELKTPLTRTELTSMGSEILEKLYCRATAQRFRSKESDRELTSIVRSFTALAGVVNGMIKDSNEEDLERRIAELEERAQTATHRSRARW